MWNYIKNYSGYYLGTIISFSAGIHQLFQDNITNAGIFFILGVVIMILLTVVHILEMVEEMSKNKKKDRANSVEDFYGD